jgi:hypothetical protein
MTHPGSPVDEGQFGVTHCSGVIAMHAGGKWTFLWRVRAMQTPQPGNRSIGFLGPGLPERFSSDPLGSRLIKAG